MQKPGFAVIAALALAAMCVSGVHGATVTVDATGAGDYMDLKAAVDAISTWSDGNADTIEVTDAAPNGTGRVHVLADAPPLTIRNAPGAYPVIYPADNDYYLIRIRDNPVALDGLTLIGRAGIPSTETFAAVLIDRERNEVEQLQITVRNCVITANDGSNRPILDWSLDTPQVGGFVAGIQLNSEGAFPTGLNIEDSAIAFMESRPVVVMSSDGNCDVEISGTLMAKCQAYAVTMVSETSSETMSLNISNCAIFGMHGGFAIEGSESEPIQTEINVRDSLIIIDGGNDIGSGGGFAGNVTMERCTVAASGVLNIRNHHMPGGNQGDITVRDCILMDPPDPERDLDMLVRFASYPDYPQDVLYRSLVLENIAVVPPADVLRWEGQPQNVIDAINGLYGGNGPLKADPMFVAAAFDSSLDGIRQWDSMTNSLFDVTSGEYVGMASDGGPLSGGGEYVGYDFMDLGGAALRDLDQLRDPDPEWTNESTVKVILDDIEGAAMFVELSEDPDSGTSTTLDLDGLEYEYTFADDGDGTKTLYARLGYATGSESGHTEWVSDTIGLDTAAPGAPEAPGDGGPFSLDPTVTFEWANPVDPAPASGVAGSDVQVGTAPEGADVFDGYVEGAESRAVTGPLGETLYARARAVDRAGNEGAWSAASDGIFLDTPPNPPELSIDPDTPRTLDAITASASADDPDGDLINAYRYEWYLNGELARSGATLPPDLTRKTQPWRVSGWARDPYGAWSEPATLDFTIENSPPTQPMVEIKPDPVRADEDLIVDVQVYSTDPDGDAVAYDFKWSKSVDGGETWIHKVELDGLPQVSHLFINEGEIWQVEYIPYEVEPKSDAADKGEESARLRMEGLAGWDRVYVGENHPPGFTFRDVRAVVGRSGGVLFTAKWVSWDEDGETYHVDLYWTDLNYSGLVSLAEDLPPWVIDFGGWRTGVPIDRPIYLHAIVTDAKGTVTQVTSGDLGLRNEVGGGWVMYP